MNSARDDNRSRAELKLLVVFAVVLSVAASALRVAGCAWSGTSKSVRFNEYQSEREMGRLPPLPTMANGMNDARAVWERDEGSETGYEDEKESWTRIDRLWDIADEFMEAQHLQQTRKLLEEYISATSINRQPGWFIPGSRQARRNSAFDQLDALKALDRGSSTENVRAYLQARKAYDKGLAPPEKVEQASRDPHLKDNFAYLEAAQLYGQEQYGEAAEAFASLRRKYPRSEKSDTALFMSALATMKTSATFSPTSGDEAHLSAGVDNHHPAVPPPDEAWKKSFATFKQLMRDYPRSRYYNDARGWIAYLHLRANDRASALVEYYRLLSDKHDENTRLEGAFSLTFVRHHATEEEMDQVERVLHAEPTTALAYAYHNIYNYAIDPGCLVDSYYGSSEDETIYDAAGNYDVKANDARYEAEARKESSRKRSIAERELKRIVSFSNRLAERYPKMSLGAAFTLRIAQANLELGDNSLAETFAQRALRSGIRGEDRTEALWIAGVAQHRSQKYDAAKKSFTQLLATNPQRDFAIGARRILAMVAEDSGDIGAALAQYLEINYTLDVAYLVDVLMTVDQLESFILENPHNPRIDQVIYALGVRYMRLQNWGAARATFSRVKTVPSLSYSNYSSLFNCDGDNCTDPKEPTYYDSETVITQKLILKELQTVNDLERLEHQVEFAKSDESKAEALYQLASYHFEGSRLKFYNPVAWQGRRYWTMSDYAGKAKFRRQDESQTIWQYMREHETLSRALDIYLEVVDRFPHTKAAPDALYTAAVCHERLANYNPYWRDIYSSSLHAGARMVTYANVKAAYPRYQLPRGTYAWEPATRTVNGGPGRAAPPRPEPRPSKWERLEQLATKTYEQITRLWEETLRRWFTLGLISCGLLLLRWRATRARRELREQLVRLRTLKEPNAPAYPWMALLSRRN